MEKNILKEERPSDILIRAQKATLMFCIVLYSFISSNEGPGPRLKKNRHRARTVKGGEKEEEGVHSDPSEEGQHTRYSTLEVKKRDPKSVERSWRYAIVPHFHQFNSSKTIVYFQMVSDSALVQTRMDEKARR